MSTELDPKTFSTLEFIGGGNYPTDDVVIYTDQAAAYKISQLDSQIAALRLNKDEATEVERLTNEANALRRSIKDSSLTFHMRGVPITVLRSINEKVDADMAEATDEERAERKTAERIAAHIVSVSDSQGREDTHTWTADEMNVLDDTLPKESMATLLDAMIRLSFKSTYFEEAGLDADF